METDRSILHLTIRRILRTAAGIVLIGVGIVGFILPVLPGWPFVVSGLILIWPQSRLAIWLRRLPERIKEWSRKRRGASGEG